MNYQQSTINYQISTINNHLSTIRYTKLPVNYQLSSINFQILTINYHPSSIRIHLKWPAFPPLSDQWLPRSLPNRECSETHIYIQDLLYRHSFCRDQVRPPKFSHKNRALICLTQNFDLLEIWFFIWNARLVPEVAFEKYFLGEKDLKSHWLASHNLA